MVEVNLAAQATKLGKEYDDHASEKYKKISDEVERLQNELKKVLLELKTELSYIKAKHPDAQQFDISKTWDLILDFQEVLKTMREKCKQKNEPMFGKEEYEKSKKVPKADLEKLIEEVSNTVDDHKHQIQHQTNKLFTETNLALTIFDALNKILRSTLQSQERRAQQLGKN